MSRYFVFKRIGLALICGMAAISGIAGTPNAKVIKSESEACLILKKSAVKYRLSRRDLSGRYYCNHIGSNEKYYLVGLRCSVTNDEKVGSNLLGWFAVRRADGRIFEWDINNSQALPLTVDQIHKNDARPEEKAK